MSKKAKTNFLVATMLAILLISGLATPTSTAIAQEPVTVETLPQDLPDGTGSAGITTSGSLTLESPIVEAEPELSLNGAEIPASAPTVNAGLERSRWERLSLKPWSLVENPKPAPALNTRSALPIWEESPISTDYAAPTTSANSGWELSMWEKRNLLPQNSIRN